MAGPTRGEPDETDVHEVSRRRLLQLMGAGAGVATVGGTFAVRPALAAAADDQGALGVDRVVRTTCSPNCTGSCGQLAFVRDDKVVKIQQAADFPDAVYNPRGCMKGLAYHHNIHGADRIQTPLVRTGERGSGEFREASWDEVLDRIAEEFTRIGQSFGYESIHVFGQVPGSGYVHKGANYRACAVLGMSHGTSFDFNGDLPMGMPITFGVQNAEHETKDWANSRFLLIVGSNPLDTRIPDAHFLFDAAERGARLVVVDPTFSATAAKADSWLQIAPGTDAALALGMVHVVLEEGLGDLDFVRTYTDGALLVRADTGKRLRASELADVDDRGTLLAGADPNEGTTALVERGSAIQALPPASREWGAIDVRSDAPRWGMLVDTERCIGCWSCAVICKSENDVALGMWWNRILTDGDGLDTPQTDEHGCMKMDWLPLACQHCDDAPCEKVCPTAATYTNDEGVVLVDADKCIGCRYCMAACPYGVRVFNWGEPEKAPGVDEGMVHARPIGTVEKCTLCVHRLEEGQEPSCVVSCPAQARIFGDLNAPESRINVLLSDRGGEQLLASKGTEPKVRYLPPRRRRSL